MGSDSYLEDESRGKGGSAYLILVLAGSMSDLAKWVEKVNTGKSPRINESVVMKNPRKLGRGDRETSMGPCQVLQDDHPWENSGKHRWQ